MLQPRARPSSWSVCCHSPRRPDPRLPACMHIRCHWQSTRRTVTKFNRVACLVLRHKSKLQAPRREPGSQGPVHGAQSTRHRSIRMSVSAGRVQHKELMQQRESMPCAGLDRVLALLWQTYLGGNGGGCSGTDVCCWTPADPRSSSSASRRAAIARQPALVVLATGCHGDGPMTWICV